MDWSVFSVNWLNNSRKVDAAVLALALVLRLAWVGYIQARGGALFGPDAQTYQHLAQTLLEGKGLRMTNFPGLFADGREHLVVRSHRPALLPVMLAGIYTVTGVRVWVVRLLMAVLSALTCVLAARLARGLFAGPKAAATGAVAGLLMAVYPQLVYYAGTLTTETLCTLLLVLAIGVMLSAWRAERGWWRWGLAGAVLGLAVMARSSLLLFPCAAALWVVVVRRPRRRALAEAALVLAGFAVAMTPLWVRNYRVHGHFLAATAEGGYTLWISNNSEADGSGHCPMPQKQAEFNGLSEYGVDRVFRQRAIRWIRENPGHFVRLAGVKLMRLWRLWPHAEFVGTGAAVVGGMSFVPVLVLAVWGAVVTRGMWRPLLLFYLLFLYYSVLHTVFVALTRYRVPMMPCLIILAAVGLLDIAGRLRRRGARPPQPELQ